jgi:type I restriction enzyme R subunit
VSHNEADTCRLYVEPKLKAVGWEDEPHRANSQHIFTDGRIIVAGQKAKRRPGKRADYILRYTPDIAKHPWDSAAELKANSGLKGAEDQCSPFRPTFMVGLLLRESN